MEHEYAHPSGPEHDPKDERRELFVNRLMAELPEPHEVSEQTIAAWAHRITGDWLDEVVGRDQMAWFAPRIIAYSAVATAPETAETTALLDYARYGRGDRGDIRREYLALRADPKMTAERRFHLDILGTHLHRRDHPHQLQLRRYRGLDAALVMLFSTTGHHRDALLIQHPAYLNEAAIRSISREIEHLVDEHGDGLRAYFQLPGIDASDDPSELLSGYTNTYMGAVDATEPMLEPVGLPVDYEAVEIAGQLHIFIR